MLPYSSTPAKVIVIVSPFFEPNVGGVETHLSDYVKALALRNRRAVVATFQPLVDGSAAAVCEQRGSVTIYRARWLQGNYFNAFEKSIPLQFLYLVPACLFQALRVLVRVGHRNVEVLHGHGIAAGLVVAILGRLFRKRSVVSIHAIYELTPGSMKANLIRLALAGNAAVLCLSDDSLREMISIGLDPRTTDRFSYWLDTDIFRYDSLPHNREALALPTAAPMLLFVGRLIEKKGLRKVLCAMRSHPEIHLMVIGDGPDRAALEGEAAHLAGVTFLGRKTNEETAQYYRAADALIVPSEYAEGFGRVVAEALCCGAYVYASNRGGLPEAVGEDGSLFEPNEAGIDGILDDLERNYWRYRGTRAARAAAAAGRFSERNCDALLARLCAAAPRTARDRREAC
ncbi:MAG TPA: glycosyltransferase family 4 protein [Candidatus Acidoferrales bacterium]|nr:glycosyltransferase family 4 protein [Candidatus Acidoferrales bacterium]